MAEMTRDTVLFGSTLVWAQGAVYMMGVHVGAT